MLAREGIRCGKERILRLMKRQALRPIQKRRGKPKTTMSRHDQAVAINRLKGPEPLSGKPNEVWCGDITYIPTIVVIQRFRADQASVGVDRSPRVTVGVMTGAQDLIFCRRSDYSIGKRRCNHQDIGRQFVRKNCSDGSLGVLLFAPPINHSKWLWVSPFCDRITRQHLPVFSGAESRAQIVLVFVLDLETRC